MEPQHAVSRIEVDGYLVSPDVTYGIYYPQDEQQLYVGYDQREAIKGAAEWNEGDRLRYYDEDSELAYVVRVKIERV
jgi:hypothetical protein